MRIVSYFLLIALGVLVPVFDGCGGEPVTSNAVSTAAADKKPSPAKGDSTASRIIRFESEGKVEIVGTYYVPDKADSPAVLLLHQWGSDRGSFDAFAKRLQRKGFGVLAIDGRGFGESVRTTGGKAVGPLRSDQAVKGMLADVGYAFEWLTIQKKVDPARVGIVGASYGSSLAIIYGAENDKVKAVALLSPGVNYFGNMPTEPAAKKYGERAMLLVAAEDDARSADSVRALETSAGSYENHKAMLYKKGGHGTNIFAAGVGLEDLLEKFLSEKL